MLPETINLFMYEYTLALYQVRIFQYVLGLSWA